MGSPVILVTNSTVQGGLVKVHPEAIEEARVAREWYHARSSEVAEALMAELDLAIKRLEETPHQWSPYHAGTQRYLLHRRRYADYSYTSTSRFLSLTA